MLLSFTKIYFIDIKVENMKISLIGNRKKMSIFIHYFSVGNDFLHKTYSPETIEENTVKVAYNKII